MQVKPTGGHGPTPMQVTYIGGHGPLYLPGLDREVGNGETIEVAEDYGAGLLAQGSSVDAEGKPTPGTEWAVADSPKRGTANAEAQKPA